MRRDWTTRARRQLHNIHRLIGLGAPDNVVGFSVANFFDLALAYLGPHVAEAFMAHIVRAARRRCGRCCECGEGTIPTHKAHDAVCGACAARETSDYFRTSLALDADDPDNPVELP